MPRTPRFRSLPDDELQELFNEAYAEWACARSQEEEAWYHIRLSRLMLEVVRRGGVTTPGVA